MPITIPDKRFAYGAAIFAAVLMGSMGVAVRNIAANATLIAFARLRIPLKITSRNRKIARQAVRADLVEA